LAAKGDRIELVIEGLPQDEGRVRLNTFITQIQKLSAALHRIDRDANDGRSGSIFQIAELSYSSPVRVALEPKPIPTFRPTGHLIVQQLQNVARAIESGDADSLTGFDADLLDDIRGLAAPVGKSVKSATLIFNGTTFDLTPRVTQQMESALAVEDECEGSIEGSLDQINIHQGANTFHVYPEVGPKRVTCHFPSKLYDDAVAAVGRRVEVIGTLRYRAKAPYPHQIAVTSLDIFPSEEELPDWEDLRGRAPESTGGLSSEAFIRELRDAW